MALKSGSFGAEGMEDKLHATYEKLDDGLILQVDNGALAITLNHPYKIEISLKDGKTVDTYLGSVKLYMTSSSTIEIPDELRISYFRFPNFLEKLANPESYPLRISDALSELAISDPNIPKADFFINDRNNRPYDYSAMFARLYHIDNALMKLFACNYFIATGIPDNKIMTSYFNIFRNNNDKRESTDTNFAALERILELNNEK